MKYYNIYEKISHLDTYLSRVLVLFIPIILSCSKGDQEQNQVPQTSPKVPKTSKNELERKTNSRNNTSTQKPIFSVKLISELKKTNIDINNANTNDDLFEVVNSNFEDIKKLSTESLTIIHEELKKLTGLLKVKALKSIGAKYPKLSVGDAKVNTTDKQIDITWDILCDGNKAQTFEQFLEALEYDLSEGENSKFYKFIKNLDTTLRSNGIKNDYYFEIKNQKNPVIRVYTKVKGEKKGTSWVNKEHNDPEILKIISESNFNDKLSIVNSKKTDKNAVATISVNSRSGNRLVIFRKNDYVTLSHLKKASNKEIIEFWRRALFQIEGYGGALSDDQPKVKLNNLTGIVFHSGRDHAQSVAAVHLRLEVSSRFENNDLVDYSQI